MSLPLMLQRTGPVLATLTIALALALSGGPIAQAQEDLSATIRSAILSDPRSARMSVAEIDAMVAALSREAQTQGVTAQDIVWRPAAPAAFSETIAPTSRFECGILPSFFCELNWAFGFDGSDLKIPIGFGASSAWLLFVLGMMIERELLKRTLAARAARTSPIFGSSI